MTEPAPNGPATLVLKQDERAIPFSAYLAPGADAFVAHGQVAVGSALLIDTRSAILWEPSPIVRTVPHSEIAARLATVARIGAERTPREGLAPLLSEARSIATAAARSLYARPLPRTGKGPTLGSSKDTGVRSARGSDLIVERARTLLSDLALAIRREDWAAAAEPARELSGLGPGLTPAGDDVLAGLALGLRAGPGTLAAPLEAVLSAAVDGRTTDLAVARVRHAAAGRADEAVHDLLFALVSSPADRLDAAVRAVLAYGHSSGADTLVGLIVGLELSLPSKRQG